MDPNNLYLYGKFGIGRLSIKNASSFDPSIDWPGNYHDRPVPEILQQDYYNLTIVEDLVWIKDN